MTDDTKSSAPTGAERRTLPRLTLSHEQFRLDATGKLFSVADLSLAGMALRIVDQADLVHFTVGRELEGTLNLRRQKYPVKARVRHIGKDLVGCQFHDLNAEVTRALEKVLDPKTLGQEMKPVPSNDLGIWYHGTSGTEFMIWRDVDGRQTKLAILVLGNLVQWEENTGLSTGVVESSFEESHVLGVTRFETLLIRPDSRIDHQKLSIAKRLIVSCNLPEDLKRWCLRRLELNG